MWEAKRHLHRVCRVTTRMQQRNASVWIARLWRAVVQVVNSMLLAVRAVRRAVGWTCEVLRTRDGDTDWHQLLPSRKPQREVGVNM